MCLFKKSLIGSVEAAVNARLTLTSSTNVFDKAALRSYSAIVQFLLSRYVTDDDIAQLYAEVRSFR